MEIDATGRARTHSWLKEQGQSPAKRLHHIWKPRPLARSIPWNPASGTSEGTSASAYEIFVEQRVLAAMYRHVWEAPAGAEPFGFLFGDLCEDRETDRRYVIITRSIASEYPLLEAEEEQLTEEAARALRRETDRQDRVLAGWYHRHLEGPAYLTAPDATTHRNHFAEDWQVAFLFVTDPDHPQGGCFQPRVSGKEVSASLPFFELASPGSLLARGVRKTRLDWQNLATETEILVEPPLRPEVRRVAMAPVDEVQVEAEAEAEAEVAAEVEVEVEREEKVRAEAEPEVEVSAQAAADIEAEPEVEVATEAEFEVEAAAEAEAEAEQETEAELTSYKEPTFDLAPDEEAAAPADGPEVVEPALAELASVEFRSGENEPAHGASIRVLYTYSGLARSDGIFAVDTEAEAALEAAVGLEVEAGVEPEAALEAESALEVEAALDPEAVVEAEDSDHKSWEDWEDEEFTVFGPVQAEVLGVEEVLSLEEPAEDAVRDVETLEPEPIAVIEPVPVVHTSDLAIPLQLDPAPGSETNYELPRAVPEVASHGPGPAARHSRASRLPWREIENAIEWTLVAVALLCVVAGAKPVPRNAAALVAGQPTFASVMGGLVFGAAPARSSGLADDLGAVSILATRVRASANRFATIAEMFEQGRLQCRPLSDAYIEVDGDWQAFRIEVARSRPEHTAGFTALDDLVLAEVQEVESRFAASGCSRP